jgi:hypothetical protein
VNTIPTFVLSWPKGHSLEIVRDIIKRHRLGSILYFCCEFFVFKIGREQEFYERIAEKELIAAVTEAEAHSFHIGRKMFRRDSPLALRSIGRVAHPQTLERFWVPHPSSSRVGGWRTVKRLNDFGCRTLRVQGCGF